MIRTRPFEGRVDEAEWVALREVVPAATAPLTLKPSEYVSAADAGRSVTLSTVLPMAWPAMVRGDGSVFVGLQTPGRSGDVSQDIAQAILAALAAEPGAAIPHLLRDDSAPRVQDLLDPAPLDVTVHDGFSYWVEGVPDPTGEVAASMERANASVVPTVRLSSVESSYWCRMRERAHLRWALPDDEDLLLDAMARLAGAKSLGLGDGTKYVGSFRAHGLLVPVWDLPVDMAAEACEEPAAALRTRLDEALGAPRALTDDERRARSGLLSRQLTLR